MFVKKTGFFSFLLQSKYDVQCNSCSENIPDASALLSDHDNYVVTIEGAGFKSICKTCFDKGLDIYRREDFINHNHCTCSICAADLSNIRSYNAKSKIFHLCFGCIKSKGHIDNSHSYGYSSDNKAWDSCGDCGTLRIKNKEIYYYWSIGNTSQSDNPLKCTKNKVNQGLCNHKFIDVADLTTGKSSITNKDVNKANQKLKNSLSFLNNDPYPIVTKKSLSISRNGYILQWCYICGAIEKKIL